MIVDASPVGLGVVLAQANPADQHDRRIVCFASRLLTDTERRYSQCEKEALAAVWGCERLWLYLFGKPFTLVTDNRAIQLIFGNSAARPPARIERWALRLTQFEYTIVHQPGKSNIADYFSRHPDSTVDIEALAAQQQSEWYINAITSHALPSSVSRAEVAQATKADTELQQVASWLTRRDRHHFPQHLHQYKHVVDELSQAPDGILLRGSRIVVPSSLRERVLELAHKSHQGIAQTKSLIRSRLWYPGIDAQVERKVRECVFCQTYLSTRSYEPLRPTPMPGGPWQMVSGDFCGPLADKSYYLVTTCLYSRWFDARIVRSTDAEHTIAALEDLFDVVGVPLTYMSDNGPPFFSHAFSEFAARCGFEHRKISPLWPRANGAVESIMKKLRRVEAIAEQSGLSRQHVLRDLLRVYRDTPHTSTKVSPADLMFGFGRSSGLPRVEPSPRELSRMHATARANDEQLKQRMTEQYNKRMRVHVSNFAVGCRVLLFSERSRKSDTNWDPQPYVITSINGVMVTAARHDHVVTRNSSFFKLLVEKTHTQATPTVSETTQTSATSVANESTLADTPPSASLAFARDQPSARHVTFAPQVAKRRVGRPTAAEAAAFKRTSEAALRASRAANAVRSSLRFQAQLQA